MIYIGRLLLIILGVMICCDCRALDEVLTVPAEDPAGVLIELPSGKYAAQIESGAVALHFPIHPDYSWVYAVSICTDCIGGSDDANIGRIYAETEEKSMTQSEAEREALKALDEKRDSSQIQFSIPDTSKVRFWVSDYDYSDNSGSLKVRIYNVE